MRALLSTRLFAARPLGPAQLRLARSAGFPELELFADPRHFDPFQLGEVVRIQGELLRLGMRTPWLHLGAEMLDRLRDERKLQALGEVVQALGIQAVAAAANGIFDRDALRLRIQQSGGRLVLDIRRADERMLRQLPSSLGICWDLASAPEEETGLDDVIGGMSRGMLLGVRVAHQGDGKRELPDEHEAGLLEDVWRLQAPGVLIYDIDDPSGFGAETDLRDALTAIRSFHAGEKRPHPEGGGGLFWAGLAPG